MGNTCTQNEHVRATPYALTMRWGAGASQLILNLSSLSWRAVLARLFEVCDRKLWCPVPSTARLRSRELGSALSPAADLLSDFAYAQSRAPINHLAASFFGGWLCGIPIFAECACCGTGQLMQQILCFLKKLFASCHYTPLVSQHERQQALVSTQCLPSNLSVCVCLSVCACAWEVLLGSSLHFSKKKPCATSERSP